MEKKPNPSGKLFNNRVLELLTRTHPLIILGIYVPVCAILLWYFYNYVEPSVPVLVGVFLAGLFSWTFFEYILHRFVFHWVSDSKAVKRFHYMIHGVHHAFPRDKQRLVMPPIPSIILSGSFFLFFRTVLGNYAFAFFSGFMIGYLLYAFIHYSTHAFRPPKNRLRFLWEYHAMHHFKYSDKAFGVSSPVWDYVFGTVPPRQHKKQKLVIDKNMTA